MRYLRRHATLLLCGSLLWAAESQAQVLVYDAANFVENAWTSVQTTLTTIESVLQTGYMVLELTSFAGLGVDSEFSRDLTTLVQLVREAEAIAGDLTSITRQLQELFDPGSAPASSSELAFRMAQTRRVLYQTNTQTMRIQTLIRTAAHTVDHIREFLSRIKAFVGNKQALQNINESTASLNRLQATQLATTTAFQKSQTMERMNQVMIEESVVKINKNFFGKWGRVE